MCGAVHCGGEDTTKRMLGLAGLGLGNNSKFFNDSMDAHHTHPLSTFSILSTPTAESYRGASFSSIKTDDASYTRVGTIEPTPASTTDPSIPRYTASSSLT